jgi:hypothetical protein
VSSDGIQNEGYFYFPAIVFSGLLTLFAASATDATYRLKIRWIILLFGASLTFDFAISHLTGQINSPAVTNQTLISSLVAFLGLCALIFRVSTAHKLVGISRLLSSLAVVILCSSLIVNQARFDWNKFEKLSSLGRDRDFTNWFGQEPMTKLVDFLGQNTTRFDLLAAPVCIPSDSQSDNCDPDFRLAALSGRRFLASDPFFSEEFADIETWRDVELLSALDKVSPDQAIRVLKGRGVTHLILDKSRLRAQWIQDVVLQPVVTVFENESYTVLKLTDA